MRSPAAGAAAIASFRLLHFDRADPGLDRANRIMSVANYALAAVRKGQTVVEGRPIEPSDYARIASRSGPTPKIRIILFMLYART